jgi:sirohydrochlorin cobaltochelatase
MKMKEMLMVRYWLASVAIVLAVSVPLMAQTTPKTGILLLAHGGAAQWNERVNALASTIDAQQPVEVAFGMASRASIQGAVDRLAGRGVTEIVAVPLFVSSWSSVITSTEYLLGLRAEAPRDLALFAKMDHSKHGAPAATSEHENHAAHGAEAPDPTSPVKLSVPMRMSSALNRHELVGSILADRARSVSTSPGEEAVVIVAHGPVPEDDNRRWLADMAVLAEQVKTSAPYAAVHYLTVRDDAGPEMRERATKELRTIVESEIAAGRRVLVVPHLLSFGGIEQGVRKRLDGLAFTMTNQALMPDDRLVEWVQMQAAARP